MTQHDRAVVVCREYLAGIISQAEDLQSLLVGLKCLPSALSAEIVRTLARLDSDLGDLVQRIGEAGPGLAGEVI